MLRKPSRGSTKDIVEAVPTVSRTAIDLFAGAGGFSLGLRRAGFEVVLANEFSVDPEWTYRHNLLAGAGLPDPGPRATGYALREERLKVREAIMDLRKHQVPAGTVMRGGDIAVALSDDKLNAWLAERRGAEVDVVVAGPPCQGFSSAGRQDDEDARNKLVFEAVRVVEKVRPKVVVIENVPGMLSRHSKLLEIVGERLGRGPRGYRLAIELVHGERLGVPQTRKRLVLIGVRRDLISDAAHARLRSLAFPAGCPKMSASTDESAGPHTAAQRGNEVTATAALGDLSANPPIYDSAATPAGYSPGPVGDEFQLEMRTPRDLYLNGGLAGSDLVGEYWNHESSVHNDTVSMRMRMLRETADRDEASRRQRCSSRWLRKHFATEYPTLDTKKSAQRVLLADHWPSLTVTSLPDDIVHFREDRIPTVREVARLQTFPDWFEFKGVRTTGFERRRAGIFVPQFTQVANAVPPRLAHAVAARIRWLLDLLEQDRDCTYSVGYSFHAPYDLGVNREGSIARELLDNLNARFLTASERRDLVDGNAVCGTDEALERRKGRDRAPDTERSSDAGAAGALADTRPQTAESRTVGQLPFAFHRDVKSGEGANGRKRSREVVWSGNNAGDAIARMALAREGR